MPIVSSIPLPFFRSELLNCNGNGSFWIRSYRCRCRWERECWKRLSVYIWTKWPERWLVVLQRQNRKNRIRSYCYGTADTAQRQVETATAERLRNGGNQALHCHITLIRHRTATFAGTHCALPTDGWRHICQAELTWVVDYIPVRY